MPPPDDAPSAPPMGSRDVGGTPSPGPTASRPAADALTSRPLSGASAGARSEEDESLYRDLLRKARGNTALADRWLASISGTAGGGAAVPATAPPLPPGGGTATATTTTTTTPPSDLDAAAADAGAPPTFFCPIALTLFRDPVMLPTGQSYERSAIQRWLAAGNATCPATGQRLGRPVPLTPNVALRRSVEDWCEAHAPWALGADGHVLPLPAASAAGTEDGAGGGDGLAASAACGAVTAGASPPADPALAEALRRQEAEWAALQASSRGVGGPGPSPPLHPRPPPLPAWGGAPPPHYHRPPRPPRPALAARASSTAASLALYAIEGGLLAAFIISLWRNGWGIAPLSVNPCVGATPSTLYGMGAKATPALLAGQWWRLAASAGLTAGAIDLLATAALTVSLGRLVGRSTVAPWASVPAIFVGGSALGALTSANLLPRSDAVGGPAGAAALWGAAVTFQALHWRAYAHRTLSAVVLTLVGAALAAVGLTPLHDNWYTLGAAGAGALAAGLLGRPGGPGGGGWARAPVSVADAAAVAAGREGRPPTAAPRGRLPAARIFGSLLFRLACAAGLAAGASAGVLGLTRAAGAAGDACAWCPRLGCLETKWWACGGGGVGASGGGGANTEGTTPAGTPACSFATDGDSQTKVTCPSGASGFVKGPPPVDTAAQLRVCDKVCQPWRPVDPPKEGRKEGTPAPAPPPPPAAGKYDPGAGVLV